MQVVTFTVFTESRVQLFAQKSLRWTVVYHFFGHRRWKEREGREGYRMHNLNALLLGILRSHLHSPPSAVGPAKVGRLFVDAFLYCKEQHNGRPRYVLPFNECSNTLVLGGLHKAMSRESTRRAGCSERNE